MKEKIKKIDFLLHQLKDLIDKVFIQTKSKNTIDELELLKETLEYTIDEIQESYISSANLTKIGLLIEVLFINSIEKEVPVEAITLAIIFLKISSILKGKNIEQIAIRIAVLLLRKRKVKRDLSILEIQNLKPEKRKDLIML